MTSNEPVSVLLVEDSLDWIKIVSDALGRAVGGLGRELSLVVETEFAEAWRQLGASDSWHLLVTDLGLGPGGGEHLLGMRLVERARRLHLPVVAMSGTPELNPSILKRLMIRLEAADFFWKQDFQDEEFIVTVRRILQHQAPSGPPLLPPPPPSRPRVFISYSSGDGEIVRGKIVPLLKALDIETFHYGDDIPPGSQYERVLFDALESCNRYILVLSPRSVKSEWVRAEVWWVWERRRDQLVPVLVEDCKIEDLSLHLLQLSYIDLRGLSRRQPEPNPKSV